MDYVVKADRKLDENFNFHMIKQQSFKEPASSSSPKAASDMIVKPTTHVEAATPLCTTLTKITIIYPIQISVNSIYSLLIIAIHLLSWLLFLFLLLFNSFVTFHFNNTLSLS